MNKKKSVQFSTLIEVHEIPPVSSSGSSCCSPTIAADETTTTLSTIWTNEGIAALNKDLLLYRNGKAEDMCGIDENRRLRIMEALEAVLDEQVEQWASGIVDPEKIANLSRKYSASSQAKAIEYGLQIHLSTIAA